MEQEERRPMRSLGACLLIFQIHLGPAGIGTVYPVKNQNLLPRLQRASPSTSRDKKYLIRLLGFNVLSKYYSNKR